MEVKAKKDLMIAALVAFALHGLLALMSAPPAYFSSQVRVGENKSIEISMVSAHRERQATPLVESEKKPPVEKKRRKKKDERVEEKATVKEEKPAEEHVVTKSDVAGARDPHIAPGSTKNVTPPSSQSSDVQGVPSSREKAILSTPPRYRENPQPSYPSIAKRRGYEGTALLSLYVLDDGTVSKVVVKKTSGHSILDRAAVRAVEKWLFEPATTGGKAIPLWVDVPIRFVVTEKK